MNPNFDTLRQQRDELYRDARSHPDSEADQMVQMLLTRIMFGVRQLAAALVRPACWPDTPQV
ncbi:MAG TPA: hypothetical protein VMT20_13205 [Terriglobia bacterium]|nr:hypothetical protein [Terriglobia bacterium]